MNNIQFQMLKLPMVVFPILKRRPARPAAHSSLAAT
jgi:hypothetical protein